MAAQFPLLELGFWLAGRSQPTNAHDQQDLSLRHTLLSRRAISVDDAPVSSFDLLDSTTARSLPFNPQSDAHS